MPGRRIRIVCLAAPLALVGLLFLGRPAVAQVVDRDDAYRSPTGLLLEMLLDETNLGSDEVEVGILTFPPGSESAAHVHGSTEIFYVLEGQLEHIVNGERHVLEPGMMGWVRPPDSVVHRVSADAGPTKALVIWAPGGEAGRITRNWERVR